MDKPLNDIIEQVRTEAEQTGFLRGLIKASDLIHQAITESLKNQRRP